ncbi:hypothetical protein HN587_04640 [Candidatus Woesearchaeota archaeon]|nr:hypothetical protein [Candidatus Woesearchaeota archaeon]
MGRPKRKVISIVGLTRPTPYAGIINDIQIFLKPSEGLQTIVDALSLMQIEAPEFYLPVEERVRNVKLSEYDRISYAHGNSVYMAKKAMERGRVYCATVLVHEVKHMDLEGTLTPKKIAERMCDERELDLLKRLGDEKYWEMNPPFTMDTYLAWKTYERLIFEMNIRPHNSDEEPSILQP